MSDCFYVYEHVRSDTGAVFYVGKGKGRRARAIQGRNHHWRKIVAKAGFTIRMVAQSISEELAHLAEIERIDQHRRCGVRLCNQTDGGDGMAGHIPSAETRAKRSAALIGKAKSKWHRESLSRSAEGRILSDETKAKISDKNRGRTSQMLGRSHSPKARAKISAAVAGQRNPFFGKTHNAESIKRIVEANLGRSDSSDTRMRKSLSRIGSKNPRFGQTIPDAQKAKQIATLKARPRVTCPHCQRAMDEGNARRWHLENCKEMA